MVHRGGIFAAARGRVRDGLVLGAIDAFVLARGRQVEIMIGDDAGVRRMVAGQDRRMAGAGFGRAMRLIARRKDDARSEPRETAGEAAAIFGERSEEHTSELQSLMRISYAVFCLKKKKKSTR